MENEFLKKQRSSSPKSKGCRQVPPDAGVVGQGKLREALVRPHRQPPRQRGGRVLLRDPQERDYYRRSFATCEEARFAAIGFIEFYYNRRRPHSTIGYRVPRRNGRVLRALRERVVEAEGGVSSGINPRFFVSEILT